jgi:hypothetical protein
LNGSFGVAHTSVAYMQDLYGGDWEAAEEDISWRSNQKPDYATLHLWDAWHLMMMGKANEGILEFRKVDSLGPLSLVINPAVDANIALIYE